METAVAGAKADGVFVGMLPKGDYTFADQAFSVEPGISLRIEVNPRSRRQGIIDPVIIRREMPGATIEAAEPLPADSEADSN